VAVMHIISAILINLFVPRIEMLGAVRGKVTG
jgi:hypothetical protein